MDAGQLAQDFSKSTSTYFSNRSEYESVYALLIYWKENDIGPEDELTALRKLFEDDFNFKVTTFPIPSERGQQLLNYELSDFVSQWSKKLQSLIIVYYAGHCFTSETGEARWAAYESGDPTLSWSACQQCLFGAIGDVLIILDCCEAAVYSIGSKDSGRFEILAATAKGVPTPEPSKYSFTSCLIRELRWKKDEGTTARELPSLLWERKQVQQTPIWSDLVRKSPTSIPLRPLSTPRHPGFLKKPSSEILFRVSLSSDLTGLEIADWLKTAPPKAITAVTIEAVILRARALQHQLESNAFPPGSIFSKLPPSAQRGILRQIQELNSIMAITSETARGGESISDNEAISRAYDSIHDAVSAVSSAIETPLLLDLTPDDLETALYDANTLAAGADNAIALRQSVLHMTAISDDYEIPREEVDIDYEDSRFRLGRIKSRPIFAEFFSYDPNPKTGEPYSESDQQVRKMTTLLCHPKRTSFHILPCLGFVHDKFRHQFGLVFETPVHSAPNTKFYSLSELYQTRKLLALSQRVHIAYNLIAAIENFHRVGWVHKGIRSDNILFLPSAYPLIEDLDEVCERDDSLGPVDLSMPWLFGFEYARAHDAGTLLEEDHTLQNNLYRHPSRWSRPIEKFTRAHDMYSLGIVLFEIAYWRDIASILRLRENQIKDTRPIIQPKRVRKEIVGLCVDKLPFQVGQIFVKVILACLNFDETTKEMSEYETQMYFQTSILRKLQAMVGKI